MIESQEKALKLFVLYLANTYTGANFSNPPDQDEQRTLDASSKFILNKFPMLHMKELEEAFSMCMSGKLGNLNIEAYYGKFTIQMLGKVVRAYINHRSSFLVKLNQVQQQELETSNEGIKEQKNQEAKEYVLKEYKDLKTKFEASGDMEILESSIYPYWGKILVESQIINFTHDQKKEIVEEAKSLTMKGINAKMNESTNPNERRSLRSLLQDAGAEIKNDDFERKWTARYAKLIVIKSIING